MTDQQAAELRGTLASPGWQVIQGVLEARMAIVQRMCLVDEGLRPRGNTDARLRAEAAILHVVLTKPFELLKSYDTLAADNISPEYQDWVNKALESGMTYAGFPRLPDNPVEGETGE